MTKFPWISDIGSEFDVHITQDSCLFNVPDYTGINVQTQCKSTRYTQHTLSTQSTHVTMNDVC